MTKNTNHLGTMSRSKILKFVDHSETYGPHIIKRYLESLDNVSSALDIGAGTGRDLGYVKKLYCDAQIFAIECLPQNIKVLEDSGIKAYSLDIESSKLPFANDSLDLIICNQILEHTKELFWIMHEITRCLKKGGHLIVGVPNIASFHNRIGLLFGKHPSQAKACSAHVRCFSKNDFMIFLEECFPKGYLLEEFNGSQFYPFPKNISRKLAKAFPNMAFSIFFLLRKSKDYNQSFINYPTNADLETNFRVQLDNQSL